MNEINILFFIKLELLLFITTFININKNKFKNYTQQYFDKIIN